MKHCLTLAFLLLASAQYATACSIVFPPPESEFADSQIVALAKPVAISYRPKAAADPRHRGDFRQTILWEVLLSWKGGLKSGDRFTTRHEFSDADECTSYSPVRGETAFLLFASGREPYADFHAHYLHNSSHYFRFLSGKPAQ